MFVSGNRRCVCGPVLMCKSRCVLYWSRAHVHFLLCAFFYAGTAICGVYRKHLQCNLYNYVESKHISALCAIINCTGTLHVISFAHM